MCSVDYPKINVTSAEQTPTSIVKLFPDTTNPALHSITLFNPHRLLPLDMEHLIIIAQPALAVLDEAKSVKSQGADVSCLRFFIDVEPVAPSWELNLEAV